MACPIVNDQTEPTKARVLPLENLILIFVAFTLGGVLKGATGAGAPFLAVPIMAILVDVPFAVAVFLVPNMVTNAWQTWKYRADVPDRRFAFGFAIAGVVGAGPGTVALAWLSSAFLTTTVALIVLGYVTFRLANPGWSLPWETAKRIVIPIGGIGGFFQGATGLSAPISVTFMNATGLARPQFIFTMSLFFFSMTLVQFPTQVAIGVMTWERFGYSVVAVVPLFIGLMAGEAVGKHLSRKAFDRIIITVLTLLAIRLLVENFL